jgi:diaminohydroxyphosphoribosylaminopyrimidine deaminase/5-amino-6-(5-phosphoribosylamino)uracil reductase
MAEAADAEFDRRMLAAAIRLGAGALGTTAPNPAVGAILVKDGIIVGRGRTASGGRPHGERLALTQAGAAARGATLYVSLEPCAHHGRTPPCADAVIAAGVGRVVAPAADPDPRIAGDGFERLRTAGVEVVTGLLAAEGKAAHAGHLRRISDGRPHVALKLAVSADDGIGRRGAGRVHVTGETARRHVQALRARFDAILVGRGTIETDDPELTLRLPGLNMRAPIRIVLDTEGRLDQEKRVFTTGSSPTWVFSAEAPREQVRSVTFPSRGRLDDAISERDVGRVRRLYVARVGDGGLDLNALLRRLASEGVTRLLVEGGARVARAFLEADLVDEVLLFRSPAVLGGDLVPALAGLPLGGIERSRRFRKIERRRVGSDRMTRYERVR